MGLFDREKTQTITPSPALIDFQTATVTADELQHIVDDWKRAEREVRAQLDNRGAQFWVQAQAAVAAHDRDELVRLADRMATLKNVDEADLREAIFAHINKVAYTPSMMHIAEMITAKQQRSESDSGQPMP